MQDSSIVIFLSTSSWPHKRDAYERITPKASQIPSSLNERLIFGLQISRCLILWHSL